MTAGRFTALDWARNHPNMAFASLFLAGAFAFFALFDCLRNWLARRVSR